MHLSFMSFILLLMMGTLLHVSDATNTLANANNSQTPSCNKTPVNNCNCKCTVNQDSRAIKSLEAKVEGLIGRNNNACKISDAVNSLKAKVASLNGLNNKTYGISDAVESLETKMEGLIGLKNKTSGISDAVKFLAAKVESISGLNNETSSIRDGVKSLEEKVESLIGLMSSTSVTSYWSYWGCNDNPSTGPRVNVVITNLRNHILLPPNQFISYKSSKWYKIPGYNSLSPELVLSVFLNPISVPSNQVLRLWYGEDLTNQSEGDNGGRVCTDVYSIYD